MKFESIKLKDVCSFDTDAELKFYQIEWRINRPEINDRKPCILILPGGGYSSCSEREGEPVALAFAAQGFSCFVLNYQINKAYPVPHIDVALAVKYIKDNFEKYNLLSDDVIILGFSAAGHLATSYSYLYPEFSDTIGVDSNYLKPFALILGYPVITMQDGISHKGTAQIITGGDEALKDLLSVEKHINSKFPPVYVFHTKDDHCVNVINSLMLVEGLKKNNILYLFDLFDKGIHGLSVCSNAVYQREFLKDNQHILDNGVWIINASRFIYQLINENIDGKEE